MGSDEIYGLVRKLRKVAAGDLSGSRNRNFEAHATHEARAARRIHRFLRGLEVDLRRAENVSLRPRSDGSAELVLAMPLVRMRRTVELTAPALAILLEEEEWATRFAAPSARERVA